MGKKKEREELSETCGMGGVGRKEINSPLSSGKIDRKKRMNLIFICYLSTQPSNP
ncbi:hypothetical protein LguiA_012412 [Lonicera macranthoides]